VQTPQRKCRYPVQDTILKFGSQERFRTFDHRLTVHREQERATAIEG
jgi:hypothetical protein